MTFKAWWLGSETAQGNFGDILTPSILDHYNIKYKFEPNYVNATLICVGSIARRAGVNTTVLGSGIISKGDRITPNANWKFVRGPYTQQHVNRLGGSCPDVYGDPALLLPRIYNPEITKKYKIGYIPHNVDYAEISKVYDNVINLRTRNYKNVIDKILECEYIVSSSLHGVIVAHAYGIPAAWVKSQNNLKGDNVKFEDYFSSVNLDAEISFYDKPKFSLPKKIDITTIEDILIEVSNL